MSNDQFSYFSASLTCFDTVKDAIVSGSTLRPLAGRTPYYGIATKISEGVSDAVVFVVIVTIRESQCRP